MIQHSSLRQLAFGTADEPTVDEDIRHRRLAGELRQGDLHQVSLRCRLEGT